MVKRAGHCEMHMSRQREDSRGCLGVTVDSCRRGGTKTAGSEAEVSSKRPGVETTKLLEVEASNNPLGGRSTPLRQRGDRVASREQREGVKACSTQRAA